MEKAISKIERVLSIYDKLNSGAIISKKEEAIRFGVNEKSIQRDIEDIRRFLDKKQEENGVVNSIIFDWEKMGYRLEHFYTDKLTNPEILAICKILLGSRSLTKNQMSNILDKMIECCVTRIDRKFIKDLINNEQFHYVEPHHHKEFLNQMWEIGVAIHKQAYINIMYTRLKDKASVSRKLLPLAILFSEFYFYLVAYIDVKDKNQVDIDKLTERTPIIFRIDRIDSLEILDEHYKIPYADRFEEGEFRKRIQFMLGGPIRRERFWYKGLSVEAVLDRFPTAKIISENNGAYEIEVEVIGDGIDSWFRAQGDLIERE